MFLYLGIDSKNTKFVLEDRVTNEKFTFEGTVEGALQVIKKVVELDYGVGHMMSSDLNHPDEFPMFAPYSIDIAAGYLDDAIADGIIKLNS